MEHNHDDLAEMLDLDAEVLHEYLSEVIDRIAGLAGAPARILDLGAGTGTGTFALARRFETAEVIAVDASEPMLHHLAHRAEALGLAGRVRTVQADLDTAWPDLDPVDLVWASNSMHHMGDPARTLAEVFAAIRPGGHLAVAEMDSFPRFLTGEGEALEARLHAAVDERRTREMPHFGDDWGARLRAAGFTVAAEQRFVIDLKPPLPAAAGRYAQTSLIRLRHGLDAGPEGQKPEGQKLDWQQLDALIEAVPHRDDLTVRAERTLWVGRRP